MTDEKPYLTVEEMMDEEIGLPLCPAQALQQWFAESRRDAEIPMYALPGPLSAGRLLRPIRWLLPFNVGKSWAIAVIVSPLAASPRRICFRCFIFMVTN